MKPPRRPSLAQADEPALHVSSLIDICFLLLIYFLVTTQIIQKEQELSSTLPQPGSLQADPPPMPLLALRIESGGVVAIENETGLIEPIETDPQSRQLPRLSKRLNLHRSAAAVTGHEPLVSIQVDGDARHQRVTDVLNALAGAKITAITFKEPS